MSESRATEKSPEPADRNVRATLWRRLSSLRVQGTFLSPVPAQRHPRLIPPAAMPRRVWRNLRALGSVHSQNRIPSPMTSKTLSLFYGIAVAVLLGAGCAASSSDCDVCRESTQP